MATALVAEAIDVAIGPDTLAAPAI